ncbi:MAG TPA: PepSY domain-containing protein [Planococcus sp. (in: firmicutes)]|nr:PepSY domain-containing protein [Planococcus sp. (in: firmicutes)]
MRKLIYIPAAAGILALGGIAWANTDANPAESNVQAESDQDIKADATQSTNQPKFLTFDEASEKALQEVDGKITDIELERDGRVPRFEVDIDKDGYEYDLKLDAVTGEILEQKREKDDTDDDEDDNFTSSEKSSSATASANGYISKDEAVAAAKTVASGTVEDLELDNDDGVAYYEIELKDGRTEYEVHVNAKDGSILKHETDKDDDDDRDDNDDDDDNNDDDDDERDDD